MQNGPAGHSLRAVASAVAITLSLQILCSLAVTAPPVLAPVAALALGMEPSRVGLLVALTYLSGVPSGLVCGRLLARHGTLRVCQLASVLSGLGLLGYASAGMAAAFSAPAVVVVVLLLMSSVLTGAGLGLNAPASSQLLFKASPVRMRAFIFSVKQTGVPAGGALGGLLIPALLLWFSWEISLVVLAALVSVHALFLVAAEHDRPSSSSSSLSSRPPGSAAGHSLRGFFSPVFLVLGHKPILEMAIVSFMMMVTQTCLTAFFVSYLKLELGMSLASAGLLFAVTQAAGVVGRVLWGMSADRWFAPRLQLAMLGVCAGLSSLGVAAFAAEWPLFAMVAVSALIGSTAVGWNGVMLSEVARLAPEGEVGTVTGGTQMFTFGGAVIGPILFAMLVGATNSYAACFALASIPALGVGARLLLRSAPLSPARQSSIPNAKP